MIVRKADDLIQEYRVRVHSRIAAIRANVKGQHYFLLSFPGSDWDRIRGNANWVHRAHLGTLDKLETTFGNAATFNDVQLVSLARNIFENLVWLRLMSQTVGYGFVFYAMLLRNQRENQEAIIRKLRSEADLFEQMEVLDNQIFDEVINPIFGDPSEEQIAAAMRVHKDREKELDESVRKTFCLFADSAAFLGYRMQALQLRGEHIPKHESRLAAIEAQARELDARLPSLVDAPLRSVLNRKWNWFDRARDVRLEEQYRFLYSYTSRLLHSTPLNIITEKALSDTEAKMFAEYLVLTANEQLDLIKNYEYQGQIKAMAIEFTGSEPPGSDGDREKDDGTQTGA